MSQSESMTTHPSRFINYYFGVPCIGNKCAKSQETVKWWSERQALKGPAALHEGTDHLCFGREAVEKVPLCYSFMPLSSPRPTFWTSWANTITLRLSRHPLCTPPPNVCARVLERKKKRCRNSAQESGWGVVERLYSLSDGCGRSSAGRRSRFLRGWCGWTRNPAPQSPWWISVRTGNKIGFQFLAQKRKQVI